MILWRITVKLFPEFSRFESRSEKRAAWSRVELALVRQPLYWIAGILATAAIFWLLAGGVADRLPNSIGAVVHTTLIVLSVLTWTVLAWAFRKTVQRSLREQLVDRGVPICINCGYDVRGSKDRCPECATRVQKKGLTMSAKLFIQNIAQLDEAVKLCLEKRLQLPALILIYSWIDIMGWLNCDESAEKSRTSFTKWVNEFLLPAKPLPCNADELWGARCGLIHRMSPSSDLSDRGKVRQIAYAWGHADVDTLQRGILLTKMNNNLTAVHLSDLLEGVCLGSFANTQALEKNPPQEAAFFSRVEQFFANIPSEMMDEFTEREATEPENPH